MIDQDCGNKTLGDSSGRSEFTSLSLTPWRGWEQAWNCYQKGQLYLYSISIINFEKDPADFFASNIDTLR